MAVNIKEDLRRTILKVIDTDNDICEIFREDFDFDPESNFEWVVLSLITDSGDGQWVSDDHSGFFQFNVMSKKRNIYSLDTIMDKLSTLFLKKRLNTECYSTIVFSSDEAPVDEFNSVISFNYRATRPEPV